MKYVFTSITKSYLPKARVCAKTLKSFHPDWHFAVIFSDSLPVDFNLDNEPFDSIVNITELDINNLEQWLFKHSIVELCTAVKGAMLKRLLNRPDAEFVIYLDPDICIYNDLQPLSHYLEQYDILLTPHLLHYEDDPELVYGNEIVTTLAHGIYNLGFIAVANCHKGIEFADWWSNRLYHFCYDDVPIGLFTDQRWCDFIPSFFENYLIIRDIGYNVATWNIRYRPITRKNDIYMAGDVPLRFFHFTGYDGGYNYSLLQRFAKGYPQAFKLWDEYSSLLIDNGQNDSSYKHWIYATYDNGDVINGDERVTYRQDKNLQDAYPDPFITGTSDNYYSWYRHNIKPDKSQRHIDKGNNVAYLQAQLDALYKSNSWKVTRPLRLISGFLKRYGL